MTSVLITSVTGTRSWIVPAERKFNGTQTERKWNANGRQTEREFLRTRSGRVPNAFSVIISEQYRFRE